MYVLLTTLNEMLLLEFCIHTNGLVKRESNFKSTAKGLYSSTTLEFYISEYQWCESWR